MFCKTCGKMLNEGSSFCEGCGARVEGEAPQPQSQPYYYAPTKSLGLGILLTFLINGAGQMYAGKWLRGIAVFAINCIIGIAMFVVTWNHIYTDAYGNFTYDFSGIMGSLMVMSVLAFAVFILSMYDTYTLINKYNEHVRRNGNPPW